MRTSFLFALLVAGCSCSDPVDPFADGSVPHDGSTHDGATSDADTLADGDTLPDAGRADCTEYARVVCASLDSCYRELIWLLGSVERCETFLRGECEYEGSIGGVAPDRTASIVACYEDDEACDLYRADAFCTLPPGTRSEGEPCRYDMQCAEGLRCAGASDGARWACDPGTCRVPLAEGAVDCRSREDGNTCGAGLRCDGVEDGTRCVPDVWPGAGEPCAPGYGCAHGLYCSAGGTCEPVLGNGAACDPDEGDNGFVGPCGGIHTFECDPETRTCVQFERAFVGEACSDDGPRCFGACVDGVCTSGWPVTGDACSFDCGSYACVDGVCAPRPCE